MKINRLVAYAAIGSLLIQCVLPVASAAAAPDMSATDTSYVLGPEDEVNVEVLAHPDFKVTVKIAQNGMIPLPYIGSVKAGGMTTQELAAEVRRDLQSGGYFADPVMRVEVTSYASRYAIALGEVTKPGLVPIERPYHLSELLARIGGVKDTAADYVVLRPEKGPERRILISNLATGDADQDPIIQTGDKIYSPKAALFYISGQVRTPGAFSLIPDMTLRMAIGRGGGLTDLGSDKRVKVTRSNGKVEKLHLDDKIQAGDVIVIGERLF